MFDLQQARAWLSAGQLYGDGAATVTRVCTDTRSIARGDLFVALRGERFDANEFAPQAEQAGAAAVVVERRVAGLHGPLLLVPDARIALGEIAAGWRGRFSLPVIGVTGSNGKTTVKEMIAAILAQRFGADSLATAGNLNNDIGVPSMVLRLQPQHRAAVFEMGMNHPGEVAWLARIAQPTVALVNNAQREHQEFMASVEATALENGAALAALPPGGVAVYPGDDPHTPIWRRLAAGRRTLEFGTDPDLPVHAHAQAQPAHCTLSIEGRRIDVRLAIAGRHNVRNALAAAACCHAIGIDADVIAAGLAAFRPAGGRMADRTLADGTLLIDDSYNANPDSVRAAIDVLASRPQPTLLVLGDMGEVGDQGPAFHAEVGAYARERGVGHLLLLGEATRDSGRAFGDGAEHFESLEGLLTRLRALLASAHPGAAGAVSAPLATVLVKGSRFMRMERVVAALSGQAAGGAH